MLTVSANTQVDLLLERIGLESLGDTQDSILKGIESIRTPQLSIVVHCRAFRRTLWDVGPGRGMSGTNDDGAQVSVTRSSLTAGDSEGRQHG